MGNQQLEVQNVGEHQLVTAQTMGNHSCGTPYEEPTA
jgi:hypothetical protein